MNQSIKSAARIMFLCLGLIFVSPIHAETKSVSELEVPKELNDHSSRVYGKSANASTKPAPLEEFKDVPSLYSIISRIFVVLILMTGLAVAFIRYAKKGKINLASITSLGANDSLIIAETRMLGNKQYLMVVEYNTQKVLIGVSPGRIQHLCFLDSAFEDDAAERDSDEDLQGD
jgi:flagellar biogenesis protein FliO